MNSVCPYNRSLPRPATGASLGDASSATGDGSPSRPSPSTPATSGSPEGSCMEEKRIRIEHAEDKLARSRNCFPRMDTAITRRRSLSHRKFARPDLPQPVRRIQPQAASAAAPTDWSTILDGRTGWHGARSGKKKLMVYLVVFHGASYFIDLEASRQSPEDLIYERGPKFVPRVKPLGVCGYAFTSPIKTSSRFRKGCQMYQILMILFWG